MKAHVRAAVAAIALAHALGRNVSSVYDYEAGGHKRINATISGNSVNAYDYDSGCHITGGLPSLFHYGEGAHLQLNPTGSGTYSGFDYDTSSHFSININGNQAQIFDYGEGSYFNYVA